MKAEIIAVGTELLLGQIVNTNAQYLSQELAALGLDVYFQTVVGDNMNRLAEAVKTASGRADVLILTGGLGPTQDDLTKEALAEVLGRTLYIDPDAMANIERFFQDRGVPMTENNRRQALAIEGGTPLPNETGLAVGNAIALNDKFYIVLPGPPKEMKPMFEHQAKPWILKHVLTSEMPIFSRMLKFAGIGESALETKLLDLIQAQSDPTVAPYAKEGEVTIRISTKAANEQEAAVKLDAMEREIASRLPEHLYANVDEPIEKTILDLMASRGLTLSAAESCTGGLLMEMFTALPGSSAVFAGGIVCYSNEMKEKLLNVPHDLLEGEGAPGAVSAETAKVLAEQVRLTVGTDFGLAITGVAGPAHSERKPVGLVYIAIAREGADTAVFELNLKGNREIIRLRAVKSLFYQLWRVLQGKQGF
ncbi:competence/damage-inducible protein A [Paenibacillus phoenicis]|uniref:Putative competence-damage inducible protein n=1 Tax=Paenibacillus phoenicis TaxID=554117 RepID=A0ABU5PHI6_9BACL|nr:MULTISPECIES: competence/damage-inducible protein A [Paenibacillus]EES75130.1 competence/damage-inducible domain protein CinA [Paenibacillus sp. oral taxon 786 str. D14]MEA3569345.1 competence/damage-inducible protein A [Paenibacillus phoenicis]